MNQTTTPMPQALPYVDGRVPGTPGPGEEVDAFGTPVAKGELRPMRITRRPVGPNDVQVDVLYTGICHSDIHFVNNDWGNTVYLRVRYEGQEYVVSVPGHAHTQLEGVKHAIANWQLKPVEGTTQVGSGE